MKIPRTQKSSTESTPLARWKKPGYSRRSLRLPVSLLVLMALQFVFLPSFHPSFFADSVFLFRTKKFRKAIAEYVAALAQITPEQALKTIEVPKNTEHGDLCVCVPKINQFNKLKGNPAAFAQKWAADVRICSAALSVSSQV